MPYRYKNRVGGEFFCVSNRGINDVTIFRTEEDYKKFLDKLSALARNNEGTKVIAYLLERNRYSLVVEEVVEGQLAKFIHRLSVSYVAYFNVRYGLTGKLFKGPYIEKPIKDHEELLKIVSNIHKYPQVLGINPSDYQWSSYKDYLNGTATWLHKTPIADYFQTVNVGSALKTYTEHLMPSEERCTS